ncbi:MAG: hypothetical protein AAB425_03275 [Bdellovibrionota bacterium]
MTGVVGMCWLFRLGWAWWRSPVERRLLDVSLLVVATLVGGFNDFNTVVLHGVYRYTVEVFSPATGGIPLWMLLFWGLIMRFAASFSWTVAGDVKIGGSKNPALRIAFLLSLVIATRLSIFRLYLDPVWSWMPFALATALYFVVLQPGRSTYLLFFLIATFGTAGEALLIQVAGLHEYHLPMFGGVPLWITLWWSLAILI